MMNFQLKDKHIALVLLSVLALSIVFVPQESGKDLLILIIGVIAAVVRD